MLGDFLLIMCILVEMYLSIAVGREARIERSIRVTEWRIWIDVGIL